MAIMLYKSGSKAEVKGVKCDFIRCEVSQKEYYLDQGYVCNPEDLVKKTEEVKDKKTKKSKQV